MFQSTRHRAPTPMVGFDPEYYFDKVTPYANGRTAAGGPPPEGVIRGGRPPIEFIEPPDARFDGQVQKARGPWFHCGNYIPLAEKIRWTDAGPIRPEMHFWTFAWRRGSGQYGRALEGLHTMLPAPTKYKQADEARRQTAPNRTIMKRPYQNRVTVQRYRGQSFSATTRILGGGGDSF